MSDKQHADPDSPIVLLGMLRAMQAETPATLASLARALSVGVEAIEAVLAAPAARDAGISRAAGDALLLARPFDALDAQAVAQAMPVGSRAVFDVHVVDVTASTNADLMAAAAQLPSGRVLVAELQTAGRGRRGRAWHALVGGSLTFSLLWKFAGGAGSLSGLSLVVGLAVARALERCGAVGVMLKWPNDLLAPCTDGWAKLGGILIEIAGPSNGPSHAVIGIGLNLRLGSGAARIDQPATDLASLGADQSRNRLLAFLLEELLATLRVFESTGFAPFMQEWNQRHAFHGRHVRIAGENMVPIDGIATAVSASGALEVNTVNGIVEVHGGELSLRPVQSATRGLLAGIDTCILREPDRL